MQVLAADDAAAKLRALVFSKTAGVPPRRDPDGQRRDPALGTQKNWQVDPTEDASLFTDAVLSHYDVVIFNSTTGDVAQRRPSRRRSSASSAPARATWASTRRPTPSTTGTGTASWWARYFRNHPAGTPTATVVVEDTDRPVTAGLPARWTRTDEWYNYKTSDNSSTATTTARATPPACTSC